MDLDAFFEGEKAKLARESLEHGQEQVIKLHSDAAADRGAPRIVLGGLPMPEGSKPKLEPVLASLKQVSGLLGRLANANSTQRAELIESYRIELYAIVLARYRPGPAFRSGHLVPDCLLKAEVSPGAGSWSDYLKQEHPGWKERLAAIARQCWRLDRQDRGLAGSGSLLEGGVVLTARHVIFKPGWFFGGPISPLSKPGLLRYNALDGIDAAADVSSKAREYLSNSLEKPDIALFNQEDGWRGIIGNSALAAEFGSPGGLEFHEELSDEELKLSDKALKKRRAVAVIGHPLSGNYGGEHQDIRAVFGDAKLGVKRFMPGFIDDQNPTIVEDGQRYLKHNCSTLGGASGGCLIDLNSWKILGVHFAGHAKGANRAVPAWTVKKRLEELELI